MRSGDGVGGRGPVTIVLSGLAAGAAVAAVDAYGAGGHMPPVVMVALCLTATLALGWARGWRAWPGALAVAAPMPTQHAVRHAFGLADTISPNTWDSIVMMACFTLAVCGAGVAAGAVLRLALADDTR